MKFISFYTLNGLYPKLAHGLCASLNTHQLAHDVVEIPSFSDWHQGVLYKSKFILDKLLTHQTDVVWLDIDTEVWRFPELLFQPCDLAIYNWYADTHHHLMGRIPYSKTATQLFCSGGVQKWAYSQPAIDLLKTWVALCAHKIQLGLEQEDDLLLDQAFNQNKQPLKTIWLPKTYNRMDKLSEHWAQIPSAQVYINHDYTGGGHRKE
jgi:hypothetical protein